MNPIPESERDWLPALRHDDDAALQRLIARWERPLFAYAWRYVQNTADANDLVAETFVRLYRERMRLRPDTTLSGWLFTTLTNLCHNLHRWRRRHPAVSLDGPPDERPIPAPMVPLADAPEPDRTLEADEARAAVRDAINRLPHALKSVVLLHHYERLSYREIGAIIGCSERGVETRLYRARQRLREELAGFLREKVGS